MAKVMLIDDELETLEIHEEYLNNEHEVFPYNSGSNAIDDFHKVNPDIILLDIEMPFMDGFQVLEKLQGVMGFDKVPIVGVTGQNSKATVLKFIGKGGTSYLAKPVGKQAMLDKVNEILAKAKDIATKPKVLLVDDELESLTLTKSMLEPDYDVMALNSSKLALEYISKVVPDVVILDYHMPLYDGRTLSQMIKKMEKLKDVPIMYLTSEQPSVIVAAGAPLPDAIVLKSAGKESLIEKLESILKG